MIILEKCPTENMVKNAHTMRMIIPSGQIRDPNPNNHNPTF